MYCKLLQLIDVIAVHSLINNCRSSFHAWLFFILKHTAGDIPCCYLYHVNTNEIQISVTARDEKSRTQNAAVRAGNLHSCGIIILLNIFFQETDHLVHMLFSCDQRRDKTDGVGAGGDQDQAILDAACCDRACRF